uniref:Transmembrane p24 trafficking protein 7 n=1 Tax=Gouania willdenowi TaxID=441366 RepID=A0A8C5EDQ2_GOUWI
MSRSVLDTVLTFELPDNARQCFYKDIIIGTKSTLMFKVVMGGHFDVDCRLEDPEGTTLYKKMKKQYDSFTFNATKNRTYKFCFSNKFSTFTHKTANFDFQVEDDPHSSIAPLNKTTALAHIQTQYQQMLALLSEPVDWGRSQASLQLRDILFSPLCTNASEISLCHVKQTTL